MSDSKCYLSCFRKIYRIRYSHLCQTPALVSM
uniref:Uncharacterized protein n=1 Tax=Arundo donax TaxID=35708 RepID=A0A0A9QEN4_ARUDO